MRKPMPKGQRIEADYKKRDYVVHLVTDELIICTADDSDSEDDSTALLLLNQGLALALVLI